MFKVLNVYDSEKELCAMGANRVTDCKYDLSVEKDSDGFYWIMSTIKIGKKDRERIEAFYHGVRLGRGM